MNPTEYLDSAMRRELSGAAEAGELTDGQKIAIAYFHGNVQVVPSEDMSHISKLQTVHPCGFSKVNGRWHMMIDARQNK